MSATDYNATTTAEQPKVATLNGRSATGQSPSYGTSPIKRVRRTKADIQSLRDTIWSVVEQYKPMTNRQVFYQLVSRR